MATNSLLPSYSISSFPSVRLCAPPLNIVYLFPQTDPSAQKDINPKLSSYLHLVLHTIFLLRFSSISPQTLSFFSFYPPSETCCSFSIKLLHPASFTSFPSFHSVLPPHPHAAVTGCYNKMAANKSTNTKNQQAFTLNWLPLFA